MRSVGRNVPNQGCRGLKRNHCPLSGKWFHSARGVFFCLMRNAVSWNNGITEEINKLASSWQTTFLDFVQIWSAFHHVLIFHSRKGKRESCWKFSEQVSQNRWCFVTTDSKGGFWRMGRTEPTFPRERSNPNNKEDNVDLLIPVFFSCTSRLIQKVLPLKILSNKANFELGRQLNTWEVRVLFPLDFK